MKVSNDARHISRLLLELDEPSWTPERVEQILNSPEEQPNEVRSVVRLIRDIREKKGPHLSESERVARESKRWQGRTLGLLDVIREAWERGVGFNGIGNYDQTLPRAEQVRAFEKRFMPWLHEDNSE